MIISGVYARVASGSTTLDAGGKDMTKERCTTCNWGWGEGLHRSEEYLNVDVPKHSALGPKCR